MVEFLATKYKSLQHRPPLGRPRSGGRALLAVAPPRPPSGQVFLPQGSEPSTNTSLRLNTGPRMASGGCCGHDHDCEAEDCAPQWSLYKYVDTPQVSSAPVVLEGVVADRLTAARMAWRGRRAAESQILSRRRPVGWLLRSAGRQDAPAARRAALGSARRAASGAGPHGPGR